MVMMCKIGVSARGRAAEEIGMARPEITLRAHPFLIATFIRSSLANRWGVNNDELTLDPLRS